MEKQTGAELTKELKQAMRLRGKAAAEWSNTEGAQKKRAFVRFAKYDRQVERVLNKMEAAYAAGEHGLGEFESMVSHI